MSEAEALAKLRWYQLRGMEAPKDSPERAEWVRIQREVGNFIKRMTPATTGAICEDFDNLSWD